VDVLDVLNVEIFFVSCHFNEFYWMLGHFYAFFDDLVSEIVELAVFELTYFHWFELYFELAFLTASA